jgi:hypothetical protein
MANIGYVAHPDPVSGIRYQTPDQVRVFVHPMIGKSGFGYPASPSSDQQPMFGQQVEQPVPAQRNTVFHQKRTEMDEEFSGPHFLLNAPCVQHLLDNKFLLYLFFLKPSQALIKALPTISKQGTKNVDLAAMFLSHCCYCLDPCFFLRSSPVFCSEILMISSNSSFFSRAFSSSSSSSFSRDRFVSRLSLSDTPDFR